MALADELEKDPVIRAYLEGVDRTLLRKNPALAVEERFLQLMQLQRLAEELRQAGRRATEPCSARTSRTAEAPRPGCPSVSTFTLTSTLGDVDLLGEIVGRGGYADLEPQTITLELFGVRCSCLALDKLIDVKRAAGRPKDLEVVAELLALRRS